MKIGHESPTGENRNDFQRRRRGIFVENPDEKIPKLCQERHLQICRPDGAGNDFGFWSYKDAAPTALRNGRGRETLKEKLKPYLQTGEWSG
ncbi:MAG: hypothetical protein ABSC01_02085 [Verrucomicrobiota bacterium]